MSQREVVFLSSDEVWARGHGLDHPLKSERLARTHALLAEYGAFELPNVKLIAPRHATPAELTLFHTQEYVEVVRGLSAGDTRILAGQYGFGHGDNPVFPGMYDSERLKVGSSVQAAELLLAGECSAAFSYCGGLHHAGPKMASGFCVFNDPAVAIHSLLREGCRVAYVDIDVHHGDGVQNAFFTTDQVLTISLHQDPRTLFPGTGFTSETGLGPGAGFAVNVPLPIYTDDETYLWAFREIVPPLVARFQADVVVTQLGVDTHFQDPLASMALTTRGHEALFRELDELAPLWLALGGGGYNLDVVPRSWTLALGVMAEQQWPEELPPGYRQKYGGRYLHDPEDARLEPALTKRVRAQAEKVVTAVRKSQHLA